MSMILIPISQTFEKFMRRLYKIYKYKKIQETIPKFFKELDDYSAGFNKENSLSGLKLLDKYNQFVQ